MKKRKESPRFRPSFTLVELLVAIAILGTMVGMVLYSLAGAQTDARVARTRGTISKINEVILQKWEEYRYRSVNVNLNVTLNGANRANLSDRVFVGGNRSVSRVPPRELARVRMLMLRDWMRMEMPDRISDIIDGPSEYIVLHRQVADPTEFTARALNRPIPPGWGVIYQALYNRIEGLKLDNRFSSNWNATDLANINLSFSGPLQAGGTGISYLGGSLSVNEWNALVQPAELLYLLVSTSNFNGASALEYFRPTEVGDADNDGLLEFHDAWGQPILWIRWPAGFDSDLVRYAGVDALDPLQTDWRFREVVDGTDTHPDWKPRTLVPLIMSRGQDGQLGVITDFVSANGADPVRYARMVWPTARTDTPYGTGSGLHYTAGIPYRYPDPNFTYDYQNEMPNGPGSTKPWNLGDTAGATHGFRRNQLGCVPKFLDFPTNSIQNTFWEDNITNHDIILEP